MSEYLIHICIIICLYLILAQSFNLSFGLARSFNLAHIASYAIGAYTAALLLTDYGFTTLSVMALSMLTSGLFAFLIGMIAIRLTDDYFAIGTLAFSSVVTALLINWKSLTRGVLGIPGIPRPELWGHNFYENYNFLGLIGTVTLIILCVIFFIHASPFARALRAQAEFLPGALALGVNAVFIRNISFLVASALAGLAGCFFAVYLNYIDPSSFSLSEMVFVLTIVLLGKPASFWGCNLATIFLVILPEGLRFVEISPSILGPMRQMLYAIILFSVLYYKRESLWPKERKV